MIRPTIQGWTEEEEEANFIAGFLYLIPIQGWTEEEEEEENRSYQGNRRDQYHDPIFIYLNKGIISNIPLYVYNANILLYMFGW